MNGIVEGIKPKQIYKYASAQRYKSKIRTQGERYEASVELN